MSHLKAIKVSIKDPPDKPDLVTTITVGATSIAAIVRVLDDHLSSDLDKFILVSASLSGLGAALKFVKGFKPKRSTQLALEHLQEMYDQVGLKDEPVTGWHKFWEFVWKIL